MPVRFNHIAYLLSSAPEHIMTKRQKAHKKQTNQTSNFVKECTWYECRWEKCVKLIKTERHKSLTRLTVPDDTHIQANMKKREMNIDISYDIWHISPEAKKKSDITLALLFFQQQQISTGCWSKSPKSAGTYFPTT